MAAAPSSGDASPVVTFSRFSLMAAAISDQVGIAGGAGVSPELLAEDFAEVLVAGQLWVIPGGLHRRQDGRGLVPRPPAISGRLTKSIERPRRVLVRRCP